MRGPTICFRPSQCRAALAPPPAAQAPLVAGAGAAMAAQGEDPFLHQPGQLVKVQLPDGRVVGGEVVDPASLSKADKATLEVKPSVRARQRASRPPTLPVSADAALRARRARLGRRSAVEAALAAQLRLLCAEEASRGGR